MSYDEVTTEQVKRGLDILGYLHVVDLVFTGGNPLLRSDIGEIIRYARKKIPLVTIYDNGSMAAGKINELRYADRVCISLSSLNSEIQNSINGIDGSFQKTLDAIMLLKDSRINVVVSILVSNVNLSEIEKIAEYFGNRKIPLNFSIYDPTSYADSLVKIGIANLKYHLESKDIADFTFKLKMLKKKFPIYIDIKTANMIESLYLSGTRDWECNALSSFFTINEQGLVSGCHVRPPLCKISELPDLWQSEKINMLRSEYRKCKDCAYLCYITYSHIRQFRDIAGFCLDYVNHRLKSLIPYPKKFLKILA